jgi:protocatechuate 3,4-dioxygenase beta subunit
MKQILILIPLVILLAGFTKTRETNSDSTFSATEAVKKSPTNLPVEFTHEQNGNSITFNWTISEPPIGMTVKWGFLQYAYQANLNRKYSHRSTQRVGLWGSYLPELTGTYTISGLAPGKYMFNVSGSYGDLSNSLSSFTIWSEGIEIIVQ